MNIKSLSLAVSSLLICSSVFATTVDIQVKENANGEIWQSGLNVQGVIEQGDTVSSALPEGFTLTPMEFDDSNLKDIAGIATVLITSRNKIRVDCNLANGQSSKLIFNYYDQDDAKLSTFTCKPGEDPKSRAIRKSNVERLEIIYRKNGK